MKDKESVYRTLHHVTLIRTLLLEQTHGVSINTLVEATQLNITTVWRILKEIKARKLSHGVYTLDPTEEDVRLALTVLRRAGQLPIERL